MSDVHIPIASAQSKVVAVRTETSTSNFFSGFQTTQIPLVSLIEGLGVNHFNVSTAEDNHLNSMRQLSLFVELGKVVWCH